MSGKEIPANGNVPQIPVAEEHVEDDVESMGSENEEQREVEELQEIEQPALETASRDSGLDSPLEFAIGGSLDSGHDSPLEGAVGEELQPYDVDITSQERSRIKPEKEDLFRKFFREEYSQSNSPILGHPDERQTPKEHILNPLGGLQGVGAPLEADLNKTGAIAGQNIQTESIQGCLRSRAENDQSLPSVGNREDLHCSARSSQNPLIEFRPPSDDSRRGLSPGSSSMSFSSRQTASTDNMQTSPLHYSDSPTEGDTEDTERAAHKKNPPRRRRMGVVAHPMLVRSKSDHAGSSACVPKKPEYNKKKISEAMSICSEPSRKISDAMSVTSEPVRKTSKDSSNDSFEPMSLEDEANNHPELSHSFESEPCLPMPDLDPEAIQNFGALTVSSDSMDDAEQNVEDDETKSVSEQDTIVADLSYSHDVESSHKPQK